MTLYATYGKRILDSLLAAGTLLLIWPVLMIVAVAIKVEDRGPAIFRQQRVGRFGAPFTILKFRSMPVATPNVPSAAADILRVTTVGGFIRRTNIDELPQLWNVLCGDMSLIGPRPALPSQAALVAARRDRGIEKLRPGLTGLAQVNSYDGMPEAEKVEWEARYAARVTFLRDVVIILQTFKYLLHKPPVY